jgi:phosphoglycolate phosphatase
MKNLFLIFDLDGTLVDSRRDLAEGINHMRTHFGLSLLDHDVISSYIGDGVRKLVERSLQGNDINVDEALRVNIDYYFSHLTVHTTLYAGVDKGIRQLHQAGHELAVLTNKPGEPSREILQFFGLTDYFSSVVGGGDLNVLKPDPEGILHCRERVGAEASSTWMVGDHHTDLVAAKNAGVKSAFVQYGFGVEQGVKPDAYFASFSELVEYFV